MGIASHVEFFLFAAPIQELTLNQESRVCAGFCRLGSRRLLPPHQRQKTAPLTSLSHVEDRQGPEDQDEEPSQVRSAAAAISARHLTARTTPRARHDPARHQARHQARTTARACRTGS